MNQAHFNSVTAATFIKAAAVSAAGLALPAFWNMPGAFAEALTLTPRQTEGPFYPDRLPLDTDNDLIIVNDNITPAIGEITHLSGKLLDANGNPLRNAIVEIWQVDGNGVYLHTREPQREARRQLPGLRPVSHRQQRRVLFPHCEAGALPWPHAAYSFQDQAARRAGIPTQCYIKGHPQNERDGIYSRIRDKKARESITIDFKPIKESKTGELEARFDIVLGVTPESS